MVEVLLGRGADIDPNPSPYRPLPNDLSLELAGLIASNRGN